MAELKNLDALADQLYQEGMERAKKESEKLLSQAREKGEKLVADAQKDAHEIIAKANKEAEKHRSAVESEIHQKAKQAKQDLKNQIEQMITSRLLDGPTKEVLADKAFVKELILSAMEKWKDGQDLEIYIPENLKGLKEDLQVKIQEFLPGVKVTANEHIDSGFKIENNGEGYILSFTEQDFKALFEPYVTKAVGKILFE